MRWPVDSLRLEAHDVRNRLLNTAPARRPPERRGPDVGRGRIGLQGGGWLGPRGAGPSSPDAAAATAAGVRRASPR
eukprot:CAMPEP_0204152828 /NCGR_PEP_ID=MMETSP0361-20130328/27347_1 /ASSEMBLY_ACC=CAM_ASM_000343 /TAXON_ID=268821 /ORGANISM="Scrippsiella Hangoei, Strain SHTV-5" /LENGTH=75 /DNA_ID=CAMNT_0051107853 /DNA_START=33 /DNA_END=256 /DNA_ORIENTATION=+